MSEDRRRARSSTAYPVPSSRERSTKEPLLEKDWPRLKLFTGGKGEQQTHRHPQEEIRSSHSSP